MEEFKVSDFLKWFFVIGIALTILSISAFALNSAGLFGKTVVERKVYENSYQRSESIKTQIATDEATVNQISIQLSNPELDESTKTNLNAQLSAARLRIAVAKGKR